MISKPKSFIVLLPSLHISDVYDLVHYDLKYAPEHFSTFILSLRRFVHQVGGTETWRALSVDFRQLYFLLLAASRHQ